MQSLTLHLIAVSLASSAASAAVETITIRGSGDPNRTRIFHSLPWGRDFVTGLWKGDLSVKWSGGAEKTLTTKADVDPSFDFVSHNAAKIFGTGTPGDPFLFNEFTENIRPRIDLFGVADPSNRAENDHLVRAFWYYTPQRGVLVADKTVRISGWAEQTRVHRSLLELAGADAKYAAQRGLSHITATITHPDGFAKDTRLADGSVLDFTLVIYLPGPGPVSLVAAGIVLTLRSRRRL